MVTLILLLNASSLALEQPGSMVRGMSGRRLLFFLKARRSRGCGYARPGTPTDNFERFGGSSPFVRGQRMVELK